MADSFKGQMPVELLKAMGHPIRYRILEALRGAELNVGEIEAKAGITQPSLSQQLAVLRNCGLVGTRRDGKLVIYWIEQDSIDQLVSKIGSFGRDAVPVIEHQDRPAASVAQFARLG
ncbi:ArsR/SmtB family transcription factor [Pontixanthobacter sp.]|uniref:ArsR/SmtB family transcription factor n=1 Tax=Pontixanthobacter sp. TaxID=2792078 RepID=UPI003C7B674D